MNKHKNSYDLSTDYGKFPTLAPLPEELLGSFVRCETCGGVDFRFRLPVRTAVCKRCGQALTDPVASHKQQRKHSLPQITREFILLPSGGVRKFPHITNQLYDVNGWTGITAIAGSGSHLTGLRTDGTVVVSCKHDDDYLRHGTHDWREITAIAGANHLVGLFSDGSVRAVGSNNDGECNVQNWSNITAIAASSYHTVGLCADGTVRAVGRSKEGQCNVTDWTNITAVAADAHRTLGLCADGTVKTVGENQYGVCDVRNWSDIVAISTAGYVTAGLRSDGTVLAVGQNNYGQCNVQGWKNVVEISTVYHATIAMQEDGTILCTDPELKEQIQDALA